MRQRVWRGVRSGVALLLLGLACLGALPAQAQTVEILTTTIEPLCYQRQRNPGLLVELVQAANRLSGRQDQIRFMPWSQAYELARDRKNKLIMPLSRVPEREDQFTWVSYMMNLAYAFASLDQPVQDLATAKTLSRIAVYDQTVMQMFLKEQGFSNLVATQPETAARLLDEGKVAAWYSSVTEAELVWRKINSGKTLHIGAPVATTHLWLGGSADLDEDIVEAYNDAFEKLVRDGTYQQLLTKYLGPRAPMLARQAK